MSQSEITTNRELTAGRLMTVAQASAAMRVPPATVVRAVASGALRGVQATGEVLVMTSSVCHFLVARAATAETAKISAWMYSLPPQASATPAGSPTAG